MGRHRSDSSSSSASSSSGSDSSHKKHKAKKDKKKKEDKSHHHQPETGLGGHNDFGNLPLGPGAFAAGHTAASRFPTNILPPTHNMTSFPAPELDAGGIGSPPAYQAPPPSGYRVPLSTDQPFPANAQDIGPPPFHDADGVSPVFIGSALMPNSVHPCKIGPHLAPNASVPYGGGEHGHHGRYDLLPFRPHEMEWVPTSHGQIPYGRRPVEGGYEENGAKLYHAAALINGIKVPGKAGEHLGGCRIPFGGREYEVADNYEILCWR